MVFLSTMVLAFVKDFQHKKIESTDNIKIDHKAFIITIDYLNCKPGKGNFRVPQSIIKLDDYAEVMLTSIRQTINKHTENPLDFGSIHGWSTKDHYSRLPEGKKDLPKTEKY